MATAGDAARADTPSKRKAPLVLVAGRCDGFSRFVHPVTLNLKPVGNAPVLKQRKFLVERSRNVGWLLEWLRVNLKCEQGETVVSHVPASLPMS